MPSLSDQEIRQLSREIEESGLTYTALQKELLDHLCCDVEARMETGFDFRRAVEAVKKDMGADCIRQIQDDTLHLINQKYRIMKKSMYIIGTIAPALVILGSIFKVLHWPGAGIALTIGLVLLALVYIPVFVTLRIRDTRKQGKPVNLAMHYVGMASGMVFILGALFKIMHWPGASVMVVLSGFVAVGVFIPLLVIQAMRDKENQVQSFTVLVFVMSLIAISFMQISLTISRSVVRAFLIGVEENVSTEQVMAARNAQVAALLEGPQADLLTESSDAICATLDGMIRKILLAADSDNAAAMAPDGSLDAWSLSGLDDIRAPSRIMLDGKTVKTRGPFWSGIWPPTKTTCCRWTEAVHLLPPFMLCWIRRIGSWTSKRFPG
ncbi:MAG: hypothetical protein R2751_16310 [Bacteroidales bacterium]